MMDEDAETDDGKLFAPSKAKNRCKGCQYPLTFAECRKQFGRLTRRGLDKEAIKKLLPRCQKCVTNALQAAPSPAPSPGA